MYVLCFTGFFRFDDISRVRRSDISFHEGFMVIQVQKSKNDQLRKGNEVVISEQSRSACPVSLLKRYLDKFRIPPIHGISFLKTLPGCRVSRHYVIQFLISWLLISLSRFTIFVSPLLEWLSVLVITKV